jgi:hypothetical protein
VNVLNIGGGGMIVAYLAFFAVALYYYPELWVVFGVIGLLIAAILLDARRRTWGD